MYHVSVLSTCHHNILLSLSQNCYFTCMLYTITLSSKYSSKYTRYYLFTSVALGILQKLSQSSTPLLQLPIINSTLPQQLAQLLSCHHMNVVQYSLGTLVNLSKSQAGREVIMQTYFLDMLFDKMLNGSSQTQLLASDLFLLLSQEEATIEQVREGDLLPTCVSVLRLNHAHLQHQVIKAFERLLSNQELLEEFTAIGGVAIVTSLLATDLQKDVKQASLLHALCSLLTRLALHDTCAIQIVKGNGLFLLAQLILPVKNGKELVQKHALRALRYMFSLERNRRVFKLLFPPALFEMFIDIGHYTHTLSAYAPLQQALNDLPDKELKCVHANIVSLNQQKESLFTLNGYSGIELLGTGAYGSVFKVKKGHSGSYYAMKQIHADHPVLGKTQEEREKSVGGIMSEVAMIREQLRHPNIVRYHRCFHHKEHLYIIMSLIDGAPLSEHITSLKEKQRHFPEHRIWTIFSQVRKLQVYIVEESGNEE